LTDWTIPVTEILESGKRFERSATEAELKAVAKELDILDVNKLQCDVRARPLRKGHYQVTGRIKADVAQACVVSLEPVEGKVDEAIDLEFWPEGEVPMPSSTAQDEWVDPQAPDGAEPIENGRIDIGRLVFETLSAGLDPYPRKPGATLAYQEKPEVTAAIHPFAALAKLKPKT
jgi:uncharacterized metal-binding protein YceD (DUF177 family)